MTGIGSTDRNRSAGIDLLSLPGIFFPRVVAAVIVAAVVDFSRGFYYR